MAFSPVFDDNAHTLPLYQSLFFTVKLQTGQLIADRVRLRKVLGLPRFSARLQQAFHLLLQIIRLAFADFLRVSPRERSIQIDPNCRASCWRMPRMEPMWRNCLVFSMFFKLQRCQETFHVVPCFRLELFARVTYTRQLPRKGRSLAAAEEPLSTGLSRPQSPF